MNRGNSNNKRLKPIKIKLSSSQSNPNNATSFTYVTLDDYINMKGEVLEWGYNIRNKQTCRGKTTQMENLLFHNKDNNNCVDEILQYN